jgi:hypothetical protein
MPKARLDRKTVMIVIRHLREIESSGTCNKRRVMGILEDLYSFWRMHGTRLETISYIRGGR